MCHAKMKAEMAPKQTSKLRLVLYSGGQSKSNHALHSEVVRLARQYQRERRAKSRKTKDSEPLTLTYIPYMAEGATRYFSRAMRRYRAFGIERFFILNPDERPTSDEIDILMKSDVIYLAGGNTYTFLHLLRRSGLLPHLKAFAKSGGVLAGLSAGAILLTPSIGLAGIPQYDPDENEVGLRSAHQLKALGLVQQMRPPQLLVIYSCHKKHFQVQSELWLENYLAEEFPKDAS